MNLMFDWLYGNDITVVHCALQTQKNLIYYNGIQFCLPLGM